MLRPYLDNGWGRDRRLADADHILDEKYETLRRGVVGVDLTRQSPDARLTMGIHGESPDGRVAPPQHATGAAQRQQVAVHEYRHRASTGHTGAASNGSESEPPGTIIGKTLASCSMTSSTSVGPGVWLA